jgi:hypothetical protein
VAQSLSSGRLFEYGSDVFQAVEDSSGGVHAQSENMLIQEEERIERSQWTALNLAIPNYLETQIAGSDALRCASTSTIRFFQLGKTGRPQR